MQEIFFLLIFITERTNVRQYYESWHSESIPEQQTRRLNGCWKFDNEMPFHRVESLFIDVCYLTAR